MRYTTRKASPVAATGGDAPSGAPVRVNARARWRPGYPALTQQAWRRMSELPLLVAAGLMIGGIAVLGIVSAAVASWLVEHVAAETAAELGAAEAPVHKELARLTTCIEVLAALIERLTAPSREHGVAESIPPHPR